MDEILKQLYTKSRELDDMIKCAESDLKVAPEGTLRITQNHSTKQYYHIIDSNNRFGIYIRKENQALIQALAQKEYAEKVLNQARQEKKRIQKLIETYNNKRIENIYENLSSNRKKVVQPYIISETQFVNQWMNTKYNRKVIDVEEDRQIITERGEIVRSKSEKILADKLHIMGIPYHYEKPLYLNGYGEVYPDFTVLNKRTRKEFYWEHLGLMDQQEYCEKAIKKIDTMQKNGIFPGDGLILTFETSKHPLNVRLVEGLIGKYLM